MVVGFIKPHRYLLLFYSAVFQVCFSCYWCLLDLDSSLSGLSTSSTVLSFHEPRNDPAAASGGALPSCLSARFYQTTLTCNLALRLSTVYLTFSLHRGCTEPWIKRETRAARYSEPSPLTYWELSVYQAWLRCSVHTVTISKLSVSHWCHQYHLWQQVLASHSSLSLSLSPSPPLSLTYPPPISPSHISLERPPLRTPHTSPHRVPPSPPQKKNQKHDVGRIIKNGYQLYDPIWCF